MQNLLSNALKFRRAGRRARGARSTRGRPAATSQLTVRDNGIGFEPQYSRRIFRVFERLHGRSEYPGTGIGLALCRKIAERHGGTDRRRQRARRRLDVHGHAARCTRPRR